MREAEDWRKTGPTQTGTWRRTWSIIWNWTLSCTTAHYSSHKTTVIERRSHSTSMHTMMNTAHYYMPYRLQRVSAYHVRMLRIRKTADLESMGNQLTQVYLENGC